MIRRIISLNLKSYNEEKRVLILFLIGILITILQLRLVNSNSYENILIGDIIVITYGGLDVDYNIVKDIFSFILWLTPHLFVLYMINLSVISRVKETSELILTRAKNKYKWIIASNLTIVIKLIEYYFVLFLATLLVCRAKLGHAAFSNVVLKGTDNLLSINIEINQYKVIMWVFLLNIITLAAVQIFLNNLYFIFVKSNEAAAVGILFILAPIFFKSKLYRIQLINNGMLRRFEIFKDGFLGLNIINSLIYIGLFMIINFLALLLIIRKKDIDEI